MLGSTGERRETPREELLERRRETVRALVSRGDNPLDRHFDQEALAELFTDDELDRAEGRADQMVGLLQQRYGYTKEKAEEEYDRFLQGTESESRR